MLPPNQATVFADKGKIFLLMDNGDGHISWSLEMLSEVKHRSESPQQVKAIVNQKLAKWYPLVQDVIDSTDADIVVERPVGKPMMLPE